MTKARAHPEPRRPPALSVGGACAGRCRAARAAGAGAAAGSAPRSRAEPAARTAGQRRSREAEEEPSSARRAADEPRSGGEAEQSPSSATEPLHGAEPAARPRSAPSAAAAPEPRSDSDTGEQQAAHGPSCSAPQPGHERFFPPLPPSPLRHLHHSSGDHPGHHLSGHWAADRRPRAPRSRSPGPRWSPREPARCVRAAPGAARRPVPRPPPPAAPRPSRPRPCAPLIGGGSGTPTGAALHRPARLPRFPASGDAGRAVRMRGSRGRARGGTGLGKCLARCGSGAHGSPAARA